MDPFSSFFFNAFFLLFSLNLSHLVEDTGNSIKFFKIQGFALFYILKVQDIRSSVAGQKQWREKPIRVYNVSSISIVTKRVEPQKMFLWT